MSADNSDEEILRVGKLFEQILKVATEEAFLNAFQALCEQLGHPALRGVPVRQFFFQERQQRLEHLVADFADHNMAEASRLRLMLEHWKTNHGKI